MVTENKIISQFLKLTEIKGSNSEKLNLYKKIAFCADRKIIRADSSLINEIKYIASILQSNIYKSAHAQKIEIPLNRKNHLKKCLTLFKEEKKEMNNRISRKIHSKKMTELSGLKKKLKKKQNTLRH